MNEKLRILLDKVYELEGLLNLALNREDNPEALLKLIEKKGEEIQNLSSEIVEPCEEVENDGKKEGEPEIKEEDGLLYEYYSLEEEKEPKNHTEGKLVFSINDRIRFKKELFENSDVDFNNTLALVASMDSYDEAEDYFVNEQGWKLTNGVEKEFLENLKRYFR